MGGFVDMIVTGGDDILKTLGILEKQSKSVAICLGVVDG